MKVLSFSDGNAYLLASGIKKIENRSWSTEYRGKILLHSSKRPAPKYDERMPLFEYWQACNWDRSVIDAEIAKQKETPEQLYLADYLRQLPSGLLDYHSQAIVGCADLVDITETKPNDIWADEDSKFYWIFENARLFERPILMIKGRLKLFEPTKNVDWNKIKEFER